MLTTFLDERQASEESMPDIEATAGLPASEKHGEQGHDVEHSPSVICFPQPLRDAGSFASGFWRHRARRSVSLSAGKVSNRKWTWAM